MIVNLFEIRHKVDKRVPKMLLIYSLCLISIYLLGAMLVEDSKELLNLQKEQNIISENKQCYRATKAPDNLTYFEDILLSFRKPMPDKTLFFHVTSCIPGGRVTFSARQACAIESAAKWNRNRDIFIIFAAQVGYVPTEELSPMIRTLTQYPNIHFRTVDWYEYAKGTPAEEWMKKDRVFLSKYYLSHLSDFIRFISVYRFGGIHLDLDFVFHESFDDLPSNFVGVEHKKDIAFGAFGFESKQFGHDVMEMILRDSMAHYDPNCWSCHGVATVSRVLRNICELKAGDKLPARCHRIRLFEPDTFYPIYWESWKDLFDSNSKVVQKTLELAQQAKATHMWNALSKNLTINTSQRPKSAYHILAEENCPMSFKASGRYF